LNGFLFCVKVEEISKEVKVPDIFFGQEDAENCGSINLGMMLAHFDKPIRFFFAGDKGTSPRKILNRLRKAGLEAESKDINIRSLKPCLYFGIRPGVKKGKEEIITSYS
jgi:hypothetical protein